MIPPDFIDDLLSRLDIVEIIGSRLTLKKTGQNHSGLCPFHTEKSPSFSVNADKQFYYCFGCQASGSAIKFVMEFDRLDFIPAIEMLAAKAGMEIPRDNNPQATEKQQRRKSIYNVLEQSSAFYCEQLRHHSGKEEAVTYLKNRGLSGRIARDFCVGFAPPGWDNLYKNLAKTNQEHDLLVEAGMVVEKKEENKIYDRFRERVMFPIRDLRGRVIAFGGRVIGDGKPKYLNSPETPVFHKGRELYGLYEARQHNRKLNQLLVVEGYMDVVALAQHGVTYAVATLGTATTGDHIERIFRMVSKVTFCFDGDTAGKNAAWKALVITLAHMQDGRSAKFLFVPDGEDPDSLIRKEGQEKFEWRLDQAKNLSDFFFENLMSEVDMTSLDGKAHLSKLAMPLLLTIPNGVFRELMIERLAELTKLSSDKLMLVANTGESKRSPVENKTATTSYQEYASGPPEIPHGEDYGAGQYAPDEESDSGHYFADQSLDVPSDLASKAISYLLAQPELACSLNESEIQIFDASRGCTLLLEIVRTILAEEIRSPIFLLVKYKERPEFSRLKQLAEAEQLLDVSDLPLEFAGTISALKDKLASESIASIEQGLLSKRPSQMSDAEKQQLRELTRRKSKKNEIRGL